MDMVYAIISDDPVLRQGSLKKLIDALVTPDDYIFDVRTMPAETASAHDIITQLEAFPIGDGTKVVVVENAQWLDNGAATALAADLSNLPDTSCLIMLVNPKAEKAKFSPILKSVIAAKKGLLQLGGSNKKDKSDIAVHYVRSVFENQDISVPASFVSSIVSRVGTECLALRGEVAKVIDYGQFTEEALDAVLVPLADDPVFRLLDAMCAGDVECSLSLIRSVLRGSDKGPVGAAFALLKMMERQFTLIWQAKSLMEAGFDVARNSDIPDRLSGYTSNQYNLTEVLKKSAWQGRRFAMQARAMSWAPLTRGMLLVTEMEEQLKSTDKIFDDPELVLSYGVMRMCL